MQSFAQKIDSQQAKTVKSLEVKLKSTMAKLSTMNEEVRGLLLVGNEDAITQVVTQYLGIPDPASQPIFGSVLEKLQVQLADWITHQKLNKDRITSEKMLAGTPGTELYKEDQPKIEAAKQTALDEARQLAKDRGEERK